MLNFFFSDVKLVGGAKIANNAILIQAVFMETVLAHGNATVNLDGVECYAIKVNFYFYLLFIHFQIKQ